MNKEDFVGLNVDEYPKRYIVYFRGNIKNRIIANKDKETKEIKYFVEHNYYTEEEDMTEIDLIQLKELQEYVERLN